MLYSVLVFTLVLFIRSIFAFPSIHSLESPSDKKSLLGRRLLSARSDQSLLSLPIKRAYFGRGNKQGLRCDSTFYKQSRVDLFAKKVCQRQQKPLNKPSSKYTLISNPKLSPLFPKVRPETLYMVRIKSNFFTANRIKSFLAIGKKDYVVFTSNCQFLGLVREIYANELSANEFILCTQAPIAGGPVSPGLSSPGFPVPVRPPGADNPKPAGAAGVGVVSPSLLKPVRPPGADYPARSFEPSAPPFV